MSIRKIIRVLLSVAVIALFVLQSFGGVLKNRLIRNLEHQSYDARVNASLVNTVDSRIIIADIDEQSLQQMGRWPWARNILANMVDTLFDYYNIKVLGFDVIFAEEDDSSGLKILELLAATEMAQDEYYLHNLNKLKPDLMFDQQFAASLEKRNVVLGHLFNQSEQITINANPQPIYKINHKDIGKYTFLRPKGYTSNLDILQRAAPISGFFDNPLVDEDGIFRRVPVIQEYDAGLYESLALAVSRLALNAPKPVFKAVANKNYTAVEEIKLGDISIPVDKDAAILVNYRGQQNSFPYISIADIIHKKIPKQQLLNKIVLVGTSAPGLLDLRATPVQSTYPGVEVHANIISSILDANIKYEPPYIKAIEAIMLLLIGVLVMFLLSILSPLWAALFSAGTALAVVLLNLLAWHNNLVLPLASPLLLILTLFILHMTYGFFVESRTKRELAKLFGQYIPPELVEEIAQNPADIPMEAQTRNMTVLFSDVRGFTSISESLDSKELSALMNKLLTPMTHVIHEHRGTIDKYMGDAIMAFWGAPLNDPYHAKNAMLAAMDMLAKVTELSQEFKQRNWPPIAIGIGINTANMSVGNMGSEFRMAYTVLGDGVNLGARLEGLTKYYGAALIVSETTAKQVPEFEYLELDYVTVKGKDKAVKIYQPLGFSIELDSDIKQEVRRFKTALEHYRNQRWDNAEMEIFSLQQSHHTQDRKIYQIYLQRIAHYKQNPPPENWQGVFEHTKK